MRIDSKNISLPEGQFNCDLQMWDEAGDRQALLLIYEDWVSLSDQLQNVGGRRVNIPEVLSESVFCLHYNAGRIISSINGANTSFDCYDLDSKSRIQVKACSVEEDLTSFGPKSQWDKLFFIHFFPNLKYDGTYKIFEIPNSLIYNHKMNSSETFLDQQKQGRRPRFSFVKEIIKTKKISSKIAGNLNSDEIS